MASTAAARSANQIEIALGRTVAACAHPLAAWRTARRSFRLMLVVGYFSLGFSAVLAVLLLA
jgi:hypothetical protein